MCINVLSQRCLRYSLRLSSTSSCQARRNKSNAHGYSDIIRFHIMHHSGRPCEWSYAGASGGSIRSASGITCLHSRRIIMSYDCRLAHAASLEPHSSKLMGGNQPFVRLSSVHGGKADPYYYRQVQHSRWQLLLGSELKYLANRLHLYPLYDCAKWRDVREVVGRGVTHQLGDWVARNHRKSCTALHRPLSSARPAPFIASLRHPNHRGLTYTAYHAFDCTRLAIY